MRDYRIVCYDFETTGKEASFCRPTEFAAIVINPDTSRTEVSFLIKNKKISDGIYEKLSKEVIEITNITDEMLERDGIELEDAVQKIAEVMDVENKLGVRTIIAGHNIINYDNQILFRILKDYNWTIDPKNIFDTGAEFIGELTKQRIDELAHHEYQSKCLKSSRRVKWNLTAACQYYGIQRTGDAHRALSDVQANLDVLLKQFDRLREKKKTELLEKKAEEAKNGQMNLFS